MANSNEKDLDSIGQHCSFRTCNRLDFLPIKCDLCFLNFCRDHSSLTAHLCSKYNSNDQSNVEKNSSLDPIQFFKCVFKECDQKEIVEIRCEFCKLAFCLKHRLPVDHNCSARNEQIKPDNGVVPKENQEKKPEFKFELKQNVSEKNTQLANKLVLMKLRQTAQGPPGLPEQSKYYCFVEYKNEKKPFYFSTKWPIGKCMEFLFDKFKINITEIGKFRLYLNDTLIEPSNNVEELVQKNLLSAPGLTLSLRNL